MVVQARSPRRAPRNALEERERVGLPVAICRKTNRRVINSFSAQLTEIWSHVAHFPLPHGIRSIEAGASTARCYDSYVQGRQAGQG